jgi:hypothetical protein
VADLASPLLKARRIFVERIDHPPIADPQRVMTDALACTPPDPPARGSIDIQTKLGHPSTTFH